MAAEPTELSKILQELADRAELIDLESRKGQYADEKRYDDMLDVRTEDSVSIMRNGELRLAGKEAMEQGRKNLAPFNKIQHMITNVLVDVNGDTANIRANVVATHVYADDPGAVWIVKGYYTDEAVRTSRGWRLSKIQLHRIWEEDTHKGPATGR